MVLLTPSPNWDERPDGTVIDTLILHYTGMPTAAAALARMCDSAYKVSAHYMVDEDGTIYELVKEEKRAWHAGVSYWDGKEGLNGNSIGIEIVNPGHEFGYRPFPTIQMNTVITLCQGILSRHPIPATHVLAHSDIAPNRKEDPGELFDWAWLARQGVGVWPDVTAAPSLLLVPGDEGDAIRTVQRHLATYGYCLPETGTYDDTTATVIKAFKRHFCPETLDLPWDELAETRLLWLLEKKKTL